MSFRPPSAPGPRLENRLAVALILAGLVLATMVIVRILLPWLVGAGLVGAGVWFWHRHQVQHRSLHLLFYEQLEARQGRISVLEFAMAAQLTGAEAREFLDARAREFFANFEPTDSGDVLYTFHASSPDPSAAAPNHPPGPATETSAPTADAHPSSKLAGQDNPQGPSLRLTPVELSRRLGCSVDELTNQRHQPDFAQWSRQRDPDSCGWRYDEGRDCYSPLPKDL